MKILNTIIILIAAVSIMLFSRVANAQFGEVITAEGQVVDCSKNIAASMDASESMDSIVEEDYPYLQHLECLENGYFDNRNLNLHFRNVKNNHVSLYVLRGHGYKIDIEARYDSGGNLIEATLIKKDTQIPQAIMRFIHADDELEGWTMIGNEKKVKNFDPYQTEYKVILSNGSKKQTLHFENQGNSIAFLGR